MSGSIDLVLLQNAGTSGGAGTSLLATLYAGSAAGSAQDAVSALAAAERNQTQDIAAQARQPAIARDIAAFKAAVAQATTPAQLLSDPAVLKVLLTANGLGDQTGYPALARQALLSDPSQPNSLAATLTNTNWKSAAQTYQFATRGLSVISQPDVQAKIADAYAEVEWRQSLDDAHPGLSNALTFRAEASTITSVDQVLGDPVLRDVVTTALGIPQQIAVQPLEAQERAISSRLDLSTFKDPDAVERFTQRYLIAKAGTASTSSTTSLLGLATQAAGLVV